MKSCKKNNKISITEEYFTYHDKYFSRYGEKTIVLLEVGSFYELYSNPDNKKGPDLYKLSEILNLIVTRKDKSLPLSDINVLMSGMPNHAVSKFLKILIDNNYTVVIYNQHKTLNGITRILNNIYSPSTFIDNVCIDTKYLMTLYIEINGAINSNKSNISIGMSAIDTSTGDVIFYEFHGSGLVDENESLQEAQRFYHFYRPVELLIYQIDNTNSFDKINLINKIDILPNQVMYQYSKINSNFVKINYQNTILKKIYPQVGIDTPIEFLDLVKFPYAIISLCSSFDYIHQHNENLIKELKIPSYFNDHKYMFLGNNAQYQLNIIDYYNWDKIDLKFQSLNAVVNNCISPMGKRLLKQRLCAPFTDSIVINKYYELTEKMLKLKIWEDIRSYLKGVCDLDKLFRKLSIKFIQPYELYSIYDTFQNIVKIVELLLSNEFKIDLLNFFNKKQIKKFNEAINYIENLFDISKLKLNNLNEVKESFYLKGIHNELDLIEDKISNGIGLIEKLAKVLEEKDENISLKIKHNDRDGYYLNTTKIRGKKLENLLESNKNNIRLDNGKIINYNDLLFSYNINTCKITYKGLSDHSDEIDELYTELNNIIKNFFYNDVLAWYLKNFDLFKDLINLVAQLDIISNNCYTSVKYHYVKPVIISSNESFVRSNKIRHPIVERIIDYEYVPHDVVLDNEINGMMVYGTNSSGKSILMKAIGSNIIMAQSGLYVSAETFEYGIFDSLYTRISGNDNLFKGHSSFVVEMNELRCILKKANSRSLIIGDEICRGTEYLSANSIVATTIIKLIEMESKFIFATHLHDLINIDRIKKINKIKFFHLSVEKKGDDLYFSRKILEGVGEQIYGITIAKYILDDPTFINTAIELKNELLNQKNIHTKLVHDKKSLYNKDIYMDCCNICKSTDKLETHHINLQKDFSESIIGKIHKEKIHIVKDSKANLIVLCSDCHDSLHNNKFTISGLVKSTNGIKII